MASLHLGLVVNSVPVTIFRRWCQPWTQLFALRQPSLSRRFRRAIRSSTLTAGGLFPIRVCGGWLFSPHVQWLRQPLPAIQLLTLSTPHTYNDCSLSLGASIPVSHNRHACMPCLPSYRDRFISLVLPCERVRPGARWLSTEPITIILGIP